MSKTQLYFRSFDSGRLSGSSTAFHVQSRKQSKKVKKSKQREEKTEDVSDTEEVEDVFNQDYFLELNNKHRDSVFYRFALVEDESLTIFKIVECLPQVLVVIIIDEEEEKHRMRVPYHKIDSVEVINKY